MKLSLNQNTGFTLLMDWMQSLGLRQVTSFVSAKEKEATSVLLTSVDKKTAEEAQALAQQKMHTGNFFAGPVAILHPLLFAQLTKGKKKK